MLAGVAGVLAEEALLLEAYLRHHDKVVIPSYLSNQELASIETHKDNNKGQRRGEYDPNVRWPAAIRFQIARRELRGIRHFPGSIESCSAEYTGIYKGHRRDKYRQPGSRSSPAAATSTKDHIRKETLRTRTNPRDSCRLYFYRARGIKLRNWMCPKQERVWIPLYFGHCRYFFPYPLLILLRPRTLRGPSPRARSRASLNGLVDCVISIPGMALV